MQTFLPYDDFYRSADCLDRQRLGKQRVETLQILQVLRGRPSRWRNHPAVRMWRGYEAALIAYGGAICDAWTNRGYKDTCKAKMEQLIIPDEAYVLPPWFGSQDFHLSHQSNLVRKNSEFYRRIFHFVPDDLPYVWPV